MLQYILDTVNLIPSTVHIQSWPYILQSTLRATVACAGTAVLTHTIDSCQHHLLAVLSCLESMLASSSKKHPYRVRPTGYGLSYVSAIVQAAAAAEFQPTIRGSWYDRLPA